MKSGKQAGLSVSRKGAHRAGWLAAFGAAWLTHTFETQAQIDPAKRGVFQAGYSLPVHEDGPMAAYGYYYFNQPHFVRTNLTLRMAVVPVYFDGELGIEDALGPNTDLALALSGGGFADSYFEMRRGDYVRAESFSGHSAELSTAVYHLFNPLDRMPLYGIVRVGAHGAFYGRDDSDTARDFEIPDDAAIGFVRTGLRLGGREPYWIPLMAGEISVWHESQRRSNGGRYGFDEDRGVEDVTHNFWARALLAYTFEESKQFFEVSLTGGTTVDPDRFSAYRLGGSLSQMSEFPLNLPGYHLQEISADQFVHLHGQYLAPFGARKQFAATVFGDAAVVHYLSGLEQPGHFHSGVGGGLLYQSYSRAWQLGLAYAYGIDAMREDGRGAHTVTFQLQYDLEAALRAGGKPFWDPLTGSQIWRGILGVFRGKY